MKTNFQMLRELLAVYKPAQRGLLNQYEYELIVKTLCIDKMDDLQLRNLRDFIVSHLGRSEQIEDWDKMSAITCCIDKQISMLGGEV